MSATMTTIDNAEIINRERSNAIVEPGALGRNDAWPRLELDVPLVKQQREMDCWYAAACMLAYYRAAGPRLGLPKVWEANKGLFSVGPLIEAEQLRVVPRPSNEHKADKFMIFRWLSDYGPIWCAGNWNGVPHVIVLTGIIADFIAINDPAKGSDVMGVEHFNKRLDWADTRCMLWAPPIVQ